MTRSPLRTATLHDENVVCKIYWWEDFTQQKRAVLQTTTAGCPRDGPRPDGYTTAELCSVHLAWESKLRPDLQHDVERPLPAGSKQPHRPTALHA